MCRIGESDFSSKVIDFPQTTPKINKNDSTFQYGSEGFNISGSSCIKSPALH